MPVTDRAVARLRREFPELTVVARSAGRFRTFLRRLLVEPGDTTTEAVILAVRVPVDGIRGGGRTDPQRYVLVLDVSRLEHGIPATWILWPPDDEIQHVNIWRATRPGGWCPWLQVSLPHICWFRFERAWSAALPEERTLGAALEFARQLLNTENHDSPAR